MPRSSSHLVVLALHDGRSVIAASEPSLEAAQEKQQGLDIQTILFQPIEVQGISYRSTEIKEIVVVSLSAG